MDKKRAKKLVYAVFSDALMIFLALLIIPVLAVPFFYKLTPAQETAFVIIDWIVWAAFLLEFVLKVFVEDRLTTFVKKNKFDSFISLAIIASPALELLGRFFVSAPLLRLARVFRLFRLAGAVGKVRVKWRRINLKSYVLVIAVITLGFLVNMFRPSFSYAPQDIEWLNDFTGLIGLIYAIISAFIITHVWTEFNSLDNEMRKQVNGLRTLVVLSRQLSQKSFCHKLKQQIITYLRSTVDTFWKKTSTGNDNRNKFVELMQSTETLEPKTKHDAVVLDSMMEELSSVSATRANISYLADSKTPKIVWLLLIYLSFALILSVTLMNFENQVLATVVIMMTSVAVALVLALIYDMDFPFQGGFWAISPEPYFELEDFIKKGRY